MVFFSSNTLSLKVGQIFHFCSNNAVAKPSEWDWKQNWELVFHVFHPSFNQWLSIIFFCFTDLGLDQYTIKRFDGKVSELWHNMYILLFIKVPLKLFVRNFWIPVYLIEKVWCLLWHKCLQMVLQKKSSTRFFCVFAYKVILLGCLLCIMRANWVCFDIWILI